ncbi:hypothetical protein [Erythrobacter aureus]|uniref:hypothetical protein n=1 Tax=Erythrobacter aureus TaxID=2182384 RepID=UPI003A954F8E
MANANDNGVIRPRKVRDGFLEKWKKADFSIASDETLKKFADARDKSSATANRLMVFASGAAFLYTLRLLEIANDLEVGAFKLGDLPFGLFALAVAALVLSTISLVRIGDSRSFDRQLKLLCEQRHANGCDLDYSIYPNENAWGVPFSQMVFATKSGLIFGTIRLIALLSINLFLVFLMVSPALSAADFICNERFKDGSSLEAIQVGAVGFFLLTNVASFILVIWMQSVDRD